MTMHSPPPSWSDKLTQPEVDALVNFWVEAAARGWALTLGQHGQSWATHAPGRQAGACFRPPDCICDGRVEAYDDGRTLTRTGVTEHSEAIAIMRDFLGWPLGGLAGVPIAVEAMFRNDFRTTDEETT